MTTATFEVRTSSTTGETAVIESGQYVRQIWPDQSEESLSAAFAYCHELTEAERRFQAQDHSPEAFAQTWTRGIFA